MQSRQQKEMSLSPSRIFTDSADVFTSYFYRKSILALATRLAEDLLVAEGYEANQVVLGRDTVYLAILAIQGSMATSGSAYLVTDIMTMLRYSDDQAYWAGFIVSTAVCLAMDMTPWGVLSTAISTLGGMYGKKCTLWAYEQAGQALSALMNGVEKDEYVRFGGV